MDIFDFLTKHQIEFSRYDHRAVYTCEQAREYLPPMPGLETKNLFLRDKHGARHLLVCVSAEKQVDLKALSELLNCSRLSLAGPEELMEFLGVEPGSVTILALIRDSGHCVELLLDQAVWEAPAVQCHPLINTSTLVIRQADLRRFLSLTGHQPRVMTLPAKRDPSS